MKIKFISFLVSFVIAVSILGGWNNSSNAESITNYYYYQNRPYLLNLNYDKIFIMLYKTESREQVRSMLGQYNSLISMTDFNENEKQQIFTLNNLMSESNLKTFINDIKSTNMFQYASPVYSMPEGQGNANTLIGVEDEVIVQFKPTLTNDQINSFVRSRNLIQVQKIDLTGGQTFVYKILPGMFAVDIANEIFESKMVNYSEPNFYFTNLLQYIPNDPLFPRQWPMINLGNNIPDGVSGSVGCDMGVDSAWNISFGEGVKVAIVDSGIDSLHEDLAANIIPGSAHDFINNLNYALDGFGHGTCCSGIVAAIGNNSKGISGVAPKSKLIPSMIFNASGSTSSTAIINGLNYSWQSGGWISSNSWGGGSPISAANNAIVDGTTMGRGGKGTVFCFATGNGNGALSWPATTPNVVAVGGMSPCNQRKSPSSCDGENFWGANYGTGISIVAPCVKVYATDITGGPGNPNGGAHGFSSIDYDSTFNGTSSATPNTSGICALMLAADSTLTWDSIRVILCRTADKVGAYTYVSAGPYPVLGNTWNNEMGYGKVNANNAVNYISNNQGPVFIHTPLSNTENLSGPYPVNSQISSVFGIIDPTKTKVYWTRSSAFDSISMTNSSGNNWTANIPGNGTAATYKYYLKATDITGRVRTYPSGAPGNYFTFVANSDVTPPTITHTPLDDQAKASWPSTVSASVTDNFGIDSVWVKWYKNNTSTTKQFKLINSGGSNYSATFNSLNSDVSIGDSIFYRIYAQDNSLSHNRDSSSLNKFKIVNIILSEGFTSTTYPPVNWSLEFTGTQYWTRESVSSYGIGDGSSKFNFYNAPDGEVQSILTLTFGSTSAGDSLKFDHAYCTYTGGENDKLQIETSPDNGTTFNSLVLLNGGNSGELVTAPGQAPVFTPSNSQWATKKFSLPVGTTKIKFKAISAFGNNLFLDSVKLISGITGITTQIGLIPDTYSLSQNYPNPFNPTTKISYSIPSPNLVTLKIYNILGKEVASLVNERHVAGSYTVDFNGANFASGIYFYKIQAGEFNDVKRMILIK